MLKSIYKVRFKKDGHEAYFSSLAAIYTIYSPGQIGCNVKNLWRYKVRVGRVYENKHCTISRHMVVSKPKSGENA